MDEILYKIFCVSAMEEKEVPCGDRLFRYYEGEILRTPFPLLPMPPIVHDFRTCTGCQQNRIRIIESLKKRYERFPNCCEWHKNLNKLSFFNKNDYKNAHIQCADSIIFCYDYILNHQNDYNWRNNIEVYLQLAIFRFGCMPSGYGSALFLDTFNDKLRVLVDHCHEIKSEVKHFVSFILNKYLFPLQTDKVDPIEQLLKIYNNWLETFPFEFPEFQNLKIEFANQSPLVAVPVIGEPAHEVSCYRLWTNRELVEWINNKSKELLNRLKKLSGISSFLISQYETTIEKKSLDIEEAKILDNYLEEENVYIKTLEDWYNIQMKRIAIIRKQLPHLGGEEAMTSFEEACRRLTRFKLWIESQDGSKLLRDIREIKEGHLQLLFKYACTMTPSSYCFDREVNNGRGPVDFLASKGMNDRTIIEFKLASNKELEDSLQFQVEVYKKANETLKCVLVVFYFNMVELSRVHNLFNKYQTDIDNSRIIIDCRSDKPSASKVRRKDDL